MDLLVGALIYFSLIAIVATALLLGELPRFRGTPLASLHWLLTQGLCRGVVRVAEALYGDRGVAWLEAAEAACCEGSNPAVQILFLVLMGLGWWSYSAYIFPKLPAAGLAGWHV